MRHTHHRLRPWAAGVRLRDRGAECVYATLDGHYDSDVATATIGWRDGGPVMEGFSSITMDGTDERGDVNYDGKTDVADIAKIISMMAGAAKK